MKAKIKAHGITLTLEAEDGTPINEIAWAMKGLLVGLSFPAETVERYINDEPETK